MRSRQLKTAKKIAQAAAEQRPMVMSRLLNFSVDKGKTERLAAMILDVLGLKGCDLSISFVSPRTIRTLNRTYRDCDKVTDVLSFAQMSWQEPRRVGERSKIKSVSPNAADHLGDIVIAPQKAQQNAHNIGQALDREICFLLIHGILHLCGHDHHDPRQEACMIAEQKKILARLARLSKSAPWHGCMKAKAVL